MADDYEVNLKMFYIKTLTLTLTHTGVWDLEKGIHPHFLSKKESQVVPRNRK